MNELHEDQVCLNIMFENNIIGICQTNWLTPMKVRELNITTTSNYINLDYLNRKINVFSSDYGEIDNSNLSKIPISINNEEILPEDVEPLKSELIDFLKAIRDNSSPLVTGEDGYLSVKIVEAGLRSMKESKIIR